MSITNVIVGGDGEPDEPDWSLLYSQHDDCEMASTEWGKVIRELKESQTLAVSNGHAIRRLVDFRIQYERAARHVAEHGAIFRPKGRKKHGEWNPFWSVMRQAQEAIKHIETELGIAPIRRGRAAKVQKRDKRARAADAYLSKASG